MLSIDLFNLRLYKVSSSAAFLSLFLLLPQFAHANPSPDLNSDGELDVGDLLELQKLLQAPSTYQDTDGDGVVDLLDSFPTDPAAAVDSDGDGRPDYWNPGKDQSDSTTGLFLDLFANNPSEWSDNLGFCGIPITDYNPNDPAAGTGCGDNSLPDGDGDGVPDFIDECPTEALGAVDADVDGLCALSAGNPSWSVATFPSYEGVVDFDDTSALIQSPCDDLSDPGVFAEYEGVCVVDEDGDGIIEGDLFPYNPLEWYDFDGDCGPGPFNGVNDGNGCGDNSDPDIDGDGVANPYDINDFDAGIGSDCDNDGVTNLEGDSCKLESLHPGYLGITLCDGCPVFLNCGAQGYYPYGSASLPPFTGFQLSAGASCPQIADLALIEGSQILMDGDFQGDINDTLIGDISFKAFILNPGDPSGPPQVHFSYSATWEIDVANETLTVTNISCVDDPDGLSPNIPTVCGASTARNFVAGGIGGVGGVPLAITVVEQGDAIYLDYRPSAQAAAGVTIDPEAATSSSVVSIKIAY